MPSLGIETRIFEALNAQLAALVFTPPVPIAGPNLPFTPTGAYLRPWLLPATAEALTISSEGHNLYTGIYQVSVFWPVGKGMLPALEHASAIAAYFKRGTFATRDGLTVHIILPPRVEPAIQEPDVLHIPVSIPYRATMPNPS